MDYVQYHTVPRIQSDLEPAFVVKPHEPCCPDDAEECVCVTSGDVEKWNETAEYFSALSGITPEDIENIENALSALTSADKWNSAYDAVITSANAWNETYETVCANSGLWNNTSAIPEIEDNVEIIFSSISAIENNKQDKIYFDNEMTVGSITGDGSQGKPYGVRGWQTYANLRDTVSNIADHIVSGQQLIDINGYHFAESGYMFDGAAYMLKNHDDRILSAEHQLTVDSKNINDLSAAYFSANTYIKDLIDKTPDYLADELTISREKAANGNAFIFKVKGLPDDIANDVAKGVSAYDIAAALSQSTKNYVEFKQKKPYPTKQADLADLTASNTIYVSCED